MLIQCQTCNAKYRLNLEKIPNRKTFIKCRQCNAPIYIDPHEEGPPEDSITNSAGEDAASQTATVSCPHCEARYKLQLASLKRPGMMLKCSACGNKFAAPESLTPPPAEPSPGPSAPFFPAADQGGATPGANPEMPLPDESRMDSLFDDLKVNSSAGKMDSNFSPADGSLLGGGQSPEDAYLDAISFSEEGQAVVPPDQGSIPDGQKYRFFMKPKDPNDSEEIAEEGSDASPSPDDLPPLDRPADGELPPLDTTQPGADSDAVPMVVEEEATGLSFDHPNPPVESQFGWEKFEKRNYALSLAAGVVILALSIGWGVWLSGLRGSEAGFQLLPGQISDFSAKSTRQGYFITNKPSGERLYVMSGQISNAFPENEQMNWVQVEGLAFGQDGQVVGRAKAYAGNVMSDKQLASVDLQAIQTFHGYANGQDDNNYQVSGGKPIPFQVVLRGVRDPVVRNDSRVTSFSRQGRQIYMKSQP